MVRIFHLINSSIPLPICYFSFIFSIFLNFCVCASLCSCTYLPLSMCGDQRTPQFSPSSMRVTNIEHRSLVLVINPFSHRDTMVVSFGQLDTNQSHLRGRTTNEEIFSTVWPVGIYRESIFLLNYGCCWVSKLRLSQLGRQ